MRKRASVSTSSVPARRIGVHDRHQLELKLWYLPPRGAKESRWRVDVYLCVPASLNLDPETVPPQALYGDIHNYIRLKTPDLGWEQLGKDADSPLVRLEREPDAAQFTYECRLFASVVRGALRDFCDELERLRADPDPQAREAEAALVTTVITESARITTRFRAARTPSDGGAKAAWKLADEYVSLSTEQLFRRAIVILDRDGAAKGADALKDRLLKVILTEEQHRRDEGYASLLDPHGDNEHYLYRASVLKKWCSAPLFLRLHRRLARRPWQELVFAIAAGIAMSFATIVAFWAQARWSLASYRVFVALVIGYMFKDRLKAAVSAFFGRVLEARLYDRKIVVEDPAGGVLGFCKEKVEYVAPSQVPPEIRKLREEASDPRLRIAERDLQETVIRYRKEVVLDTDKLGRRRGKRGLTDILRFHIARLLHQMDEPEQEIEYIDAETLRLAPIAGSKTYHVDVAFRFESADGEAQTNLMRLVLDRRGIKRIERPGPDPGRRPEAPGTPGDARRAARH